MGLLDRLRGRSSSSPFGPPDTPEMWRTQSAWLDTWGPPRNLIVGEQHRQAVLRSLAACEGCCFRLIDVTLQAEPTNPHDENAIGAFVGGEHVGYLRRDLAEQIADGCAEHRLAVPTMVVAGVLRGGDRQRGKALSIGAHIWLDRRITPGPRIVFDDEQHLVRWPPLQKELDVLIR